jgi:hypothetical protein
MNLDEVKSAWNEYDKSLEQNKINVKLLKTVSVDRMQGLLRSFKIGIIVEIVINFLFFRYMVGLMIEYIETPVYWISALIIALLSLGMLVWNIYAIVSLAIIRYDDSIAKLQKKLETLHAQNHFRHTTLQYILFPLVMAILVIIGLKALGFIVSDHLDIIFYGVIGSLIVLPFVVWIIKRFPDTEMEKAIGFLKEIRKFEDQGSGHVKGNTR